MKKTIIALAITLTFTACGNHTFDDIEDIIFVESSSSELEISSSSKNNTNNFGVGGGVVPPDDYISTPSYIANSQGTVIVGPLLKTEWGKGSPYDPFYTLPDGAVEWVMCWRVATAQILKYHNYPKRDIVYGIDFDWNNMLDSYRNVNLTEPQRKAITTLIHSVYRIDYSYGFFVESFGYDKSLQWRYHKDYDNSTWEKIIKEQLDSGLPVYYVGSDSIVGVPHAVVIDGYDSKGKFHVNWGWGGSRDGYYSLDSLNPGHPEYPNGFSYDAYMIINIQPDKGSSGIELTEFSSDKNTAHINESFTVAVNARNMSYNTFSGKLGVALIDNGGKIVEIVGTKSVGSLYAGNHFGYPVSITCEIPAGVASGQYRLGIAIKSNDTEKWTLLTTTSNNTPTAINFTVIAPLVSTFTDDRNGKVYKKVTIGTQTWMASNLNYAVRQQMRQWQWQKSK